MAKIAKYKIVENYILEQIQNEKIKIGDQIETEKQICEKLGISPLTVNKAIVNLARMGYIKRIAGKGSFVTSTIVTRDISKPSTFLDDLEKRGIHAGSKLLDYQIIKARSVPKIAAKLNLEDHDIIHYFERLRTGNGVPMAIIYTYIAAKSVPAIDVMELSSETFSLKHYLKSIGIESAGTKAILSATLPTEDQEKKLSIKNCALFKNANLNYDKDRVPYNYTETFYVSNRYRFTAGIGNMQGCSFTEDVEIADLDFPKI